MKKIDQKIFLLFLAISIALWIVAAITDYLFFVDHDTFLNALFFNLTEYEIYMRATGFFLLICISLIFSYYINELKQSRTNLQNILNNVIPICITDKNFKIVQRNKSYNALFNPDDNQEPHGYCYEERPGDNCKGDKCPIVNIIQKGKNMYATESIKSKKGRPDQHYIVTATPYLDQKGNRLGIIVSFQDITSRIILEKEKGQLIEELQEALAKVKLLSGFLPICASCKKIRDDKGYWTQLETYIKDHSEAEFSHGICPACAEEHYGYLNKP